MATLKDVAKLAQVSTITASRALSEKGLVSAETTLRVKNAATQLKYQINRAAKGLRTGRTHLIAVEVPIKGTYDPLLFDFASGVSEACKRRGYSMLIDRSTSLDDLKTIAQKVDGVVITDVRQDDERIEQLAAVIPIAVFGPTEMNVPCLNLDEAHSMRLAFDHLTGYGYHHIAFITGDGDAKFFAERLRLYTSFIREIGGEPCVASGSYDAMGGYEAMASLAELPEAVICVSDITAVGVMRFLNDRAKRIIPVVGADGGFVTDLTFPRLTSVTQPFFEAGERIAEALVNFIEGGEPIRELVCPELVEKESTWPKEGGTKHP